ncbi:MAG TPA: HigA family addiction module antitoxin [Candidatus Binataceae bacterium]|nr:HigA family addiction module antitoxin [Candidatus Binataceae bacterium]
MRAPSTERCPTHPGAIFREDVLPALKISVSRAARELGITRQTLHRILAEKASITPEMAARLGRFCGNGAGLWLRMQQEYDLWRVERALAAKLRKIPVHRSRSAA